MFNFDGSNVNLTIAFFSGVITFFASCLLPLIPTYIAHLTNTIYDHQPKRREIFLNSVVFTLGFLVIFIILGASASSVGLLLTRNRFLVQKIGGVFLILIGLFMLRIFKPAFMYREKHFDLEIKSPKVKLLNSFLFGLTFGFAWSPCVGPVLAVILFWASQAATVAKGMLLLLVYGLGIGVPFILIGLFFEKFGTKILHQEKVGKTLNIIASLLIIFTGLALLTGKYYAIVLPLLRFFGIDTLSI